MLDKPLLTFNYKQIQALRKGLGFSLQELADRLRVSKQAVSSWENGQTRPALANLLQIVNLTGAKLESFFVLNCAGADRNSKI